MRILVVEDDAVVAMLLGKVFESKGYDIEHVSDGRAAEDRISGDPPDLVVLDYVMPQRSGLDVLKTIRASEGWRDVPVLFLSARTEQADIDEVLGAGADDYVKKPFGTKDLVDRVKALIAR